MPWSLHTERDFGQRMLAQEGLAAVLGITRKAVGRWEAGETYPKAAHLPTLLAL